jgi:hypothetical protein
VQPLLALVLAQSGGADWTIVADRYGLPIVFIILVLFGRFVPGFVYERRYTEVQEKDQRIETLEKALREEVIPALVLATEAVRKSSDLTSRLEALIVELTHELDRLRR